MWRNDKAVVTIHHTDDPGSNPELKWELLSLVLAAAELQKARSAVGLEISR